MIQFGVTLANGVSAPAKAASSSMLTLGASVKRAQAELRGLSSQLTLAKSVGDIDGYRRYSAAVDGAKRNLFGMTEQLRTQQSTSVMARQSFSAMSTELSQLGIVLGAVVAAGVAVVGALVAITAAAARLALESVSLRMRLTATFDALGQGPNAGKRTIAMLDDLSRKLPQTRAGLAEWTKVYMAMGMTDLGQLRGQLIATASAQAIMGDEGAQAFQTLTRRIQEAVATHTGLKIADRQLASLAATGANVTDVAAKMGLSAQALRNQLKAGTVDAGKFGNALNAALISKGKGPLAQAALDLPSQFAKAKETISKLFEGVNVKPFLLELKGLFGIFDQAKPSGQAMAKGITFGLNNAMVFLGGAARTLKHFFLDLEIWGLEGYIAAKPLIRGLHAVDALMGKLVPSSTKAGSSMQLAMYTPVGGLIFLWKAGLRVAGMFTKMAVDAVKAGKDLAIGLVRGIVQGAESVIGAAKGLAKGALDAIKATLGIASPSRVMIRFGGYTAAGFATGMRQQAPMVRSASVGIGTSAVAGVSLRIGSAPHVPMGRRFGASLRAGMGPREPMARRFGREMLPPMTMRHQEPRAAAAAHGGRPVQVTVMPGAIRIEGGTKGAQELTEEALSLVFERAALASGFG